ATAPLYTLSLHDALPIFLSMLPAMAGGTLAAGPAANEAAFELDRIEWTDGERIEVEGRWLGVRGRRFVRPTLTLRGPGGERRMLDRKSTRLNSSHVSISY